MKEKMYDFGPFGKWSESTLLSFKLECSFYKIPEEANWRRTYTIEPLRLILEQTFKELDRYTKHYWKRWTLLSVVHEMRDVNELIDKVDFYYNEVQPIIIALHEKEDKNGKEE